MLSGDFGQAIRRVLGHEGVVSSKETFRCKKAQRVTASALLSLKDVALANTVLMVANLAVQ